MMRIRLRLLVVLGMVAGCATTPVSPVVGGVTATIEASLARDFVLGPGQAASIEGTSVAVLFRSVTADSRCPVDVQCVWAGDAAVLVTVSSGSAGDERDATLHTGLEPKATTVGGDEIRLTGVEPAPHSGTPIPPSSYRVTLRVTRLP
jgi:hypothetical protein